MGSRKHFTPEFKREAVQLLEREPSVTPSHSLPASDFSSPPRR